MSKSFAGWHRPILAVIPINLVPSSRLLAYPSSSSSRTSLLKLERPLRHSVFFVFVHIRPEPFRSLRQTSLTPSVSYCPQRSSSLPVNVFFFTRGTSSFLSEVFLLPTRALTSSWCQPAGVSFLFHPSFPLDFTGAWLTYSGLVRRKLGPLLVEVRDAYDPEGSCRRA
jgi:hypothetical protein